MLSKSKIYECGTLRYTLGGLLLTAGLIMVGFFSMGFMSASMSVVSLRLKDLGASDTVLTLILSTISGIFNITVCPSVSFKSDRYRGKRFGRRIYFIITTMPMIVIAMLLMAGSTWMGDVLSGLLKNFFDVSPATATIFIIGCIMTMYYFFYMFVASVIYYIYNDIIPREYLARVVGCVQIASTAASSLFSFFFFQYARSHFSQLLILGAIVYATGVLLMSLFIKEPVYPPLSEEDQKKSNGIRGIGTFMRESFSHRFYWYCFLGCAFGSACNCTGTFGTFLSLHLGLSLEQLGKLGGISGMVGVFLSMGVAALCTVFVDRWHPMRFFTGVTIFFMVIPLGGGKWMFFNLSPESIFLISLVSGIAVLFMGRLVGISSLPALMRTFPKSRFGQFCSAQAMFRSLVTLLAGLLLGLIIDTAKRLLGTGDYLYRYLPIWDLFFRSLSVTFYVLTYREWRRLGGEKGYKAPAPWDKSKYEPMETSSYIPAKAHLVIRSLFFWDAIMVAYAAFGFVFFNFIAPARAMYYELALPCSLALLGLWITIRLKIAANIHGRVAGKSDSCGVPHHGIMFMAGIQQMMLLGSAINEAIVVSRENAVLASKFWSYECCLTLLPVICVAIFTFAERGADVEK